MTYFEKANKIFREGLNKPTVLLERIAAWATSLLFTPWLLGMVDGLNY